MSEEQGNGTIHIKSTLPSLCKECAKKEIDNNKGVIGALTEYSAKRYEAAAARSSDHMEDLIVDGLTVVSNEELKALMQDIAEAELLPRLFSNGHTRPLKHNNRCDTNTTVEIETGKEEETFQNEHPERRWLNLFHLDERGARNTTINNQMVPIQTWLGEFLFTHEHNASMAVLTGKALKSNGEGLNGEEFECRGKRIEEMRKINDEPLVRVQDVNALIKGPSLNEAQSPHVDGYGLKIVVIYVYECGDAGYEFHYIEGSHALLESHKQHAKGTRLPMKDMTTIKVKKGDFIMFWESLVHAGGAASTRIPLAGKAATQARARYERLGSTNFIWFAGTDTTKLPVDLSLQWTFQCAGSPSGAMVPNRTNCWYKHTDQLFDDECCHYCNDSLQPDSVIWGLCHHTIHRSCLSGSDDAPICPVCKSRKKWKLDSSADKFRNVINKQKKDCVVEKMLKEARKKVIARICNPEMKILPKRKRCA